MSASLPVPLGLLLRRRGQLLDEVVEGHHLLRHWIVSCQLTTYVRPVLWREAGAPLFETQKLFFIEHLAEVAKSGSR